MLNFLSYLALSIAASASSGAPQAPASNPLVGAWVLERFVDMPEGAEAIYPMGVRPVGVFIFTEDCHFSFNAMRRPNEPDQTSDAPWTPSWYISYFGTYRYDPARSRWTTHVEGGNIPSYIGTDQTRPFTISGDTLTIANSYVDEGRTIHIDRTLRRTTAAPDSRQPEPTTPSSVSSCAGD